MKQYGFIYIWYDKKRKMYYIGSHWGTENDGYICSSNRMRNAYNRRKQDFKRRILKRIYTNRKELFEYEYMWLNLIKPEELGIKYYNFTTNIAIPNGNGFISEETKEKLRGKIPWNKGKHLSEEAKEKLRQANLGKKLSEETKEKMRQAKLGKKSPMKGKHLSEETKEKLRQANLGKKSPMKGKHLSEETKQKIRQANLGMSEETKEKIRQANLGKKLSKETKQKISNTLKGKLKPGNKK